jgi:single-stranded DNA-binding protein
MNCCALVGHVARNPVTRFEREGVQVTTFTLSIDERSYGPERKSFTLFVPCTAWGKSAEACAVLNGADLVSVQGRLTWRAHKAKCGQEHSTLVVRVQAVAVLEHAAAVGA